MCSDFALPPHSCTLSAVLVSPRCGGGGGPSAGAAAAPAGARAGELGASRSRRPSSPSACKRTGEARHAPPPPPGFPCPAAPPQARADLKAGGGGGAARGTSPMCGAMVPSNVGWARQRRGLAPRPPPPARGRGGLPAGSFPPSSRCLLAPRRTLSRWCVLP